MPHGVAHAVFPAVHQLIRILRVLRNIPQLVSKHPCRRPNFFQKALGLLLLLLLLRRTSGLLLKRRRRSQCSSNTKERERARHRDVDVGVGKKKSGLAAGTQLALIWRDIIYIALLIALPMYFKRRAWLDFLPARWR